MSQPLVITADLHLHPWRLNSRDGGRDRLQDGLSALRQSLQVARHLGGVWVFAGDMKVPRTTWVQEALNGAIAVFEEFPELRKILLPGNHDGPGLPGGSGLRAFAALEGVELLDVPTLLPATEPGLAAWPGEADDRGLDDFVERARREGCRLLLGHGLFTGSILSSGIAGEGLDAARFGVGDAFRLAVFGDVHRGQVLTSKGWYPFDRGLHQTEQGCYAVGGAKFSGQIVYPGDPYQQNWGEAGEVPKGCLVIRPDTEQVDLVELEGPRYLALDYTDWADALRDTFLDFVEGRAAVGGEAVGSWRGNFVRLLLPEWGDDKVVQAALRGLPDRVGTRSFVALPQRRPRPEQRRAEVHAGQKARDLLGSYMKWRPAEDLDSKAVMEAGMRLWGSE